MMGDGKKLEFKLLLGKCKDAKVYRQGYVRAKRKEEKYDKTI
jgi:hypothetical protein